MCVGLFVLSQSPLIAGSVAEEHLGKSGQHTASARSGRFPQAAGRLVLVATYLDRIGRGTATWRR